MENGTSSVKQEKALAKGFLLITKFVRGMIDIRRISICRFLKSTGVCQGWKRHASEN